jgi:hypothetical protein
VDSVERVVPKAEWKQRARKTQMSVLVTPTLEALAVVVCKNACKKWDDICQQESTNGDEETETSSLTNGSERGNNRHLHTGDSKGSRKHEGWSAEGMKSCNHALDLVTLQRRRPGCTFDRNLIKRIAGQPKRGKHAEDANQAPRVKNNIDQLMQIAGVKFS